MRKREQHRKQIPNPLSTVSIWTRDNLWWLYDEKTNTAIPNIPKNGSSSIKNFFPNCDIIPFNDKCRHAQQVVVLRDPVERWYSGIMEFMRRNNVKQRDIMNDTFLWTLANGIVFDEHTLPQSEFVSKVNWDKAVCFWFDKSFTEKWNFHFKSQNMATTNVGHKWQLKDGSFVIDRLKDFMQNTEVDVRVPARRESNIGRTLEEAIRAYYRHDYELVWSRKYV